MCIWKDPSDVFFVDIGCGNGLLVYLLISEGFRGLGVDIRHRRIWDSYPASVRESLKESTLDAEHNPGFPQANWLIGNHSDELTPWIPVLAARTSHSCKVFVIPCCPFGLFGKYGNFKHSDTQSGISSTDAWVKSEVHKQSHYRAYIEYLKGLFFACWFKPEVDTLRIPSTKRICILGRHLISDEKTDPTLYLERMSAIGRAIEDERRCIKSNSTVFVPRDHDEPVLNCTSLPSEVKLSVGDLIFKAVLDGRPDIELFKSQNLVVSADGKVKTLDGRWWNPGGYLNLNDVATLVPSHHLELMKMQHGGLQTLLRNHHQAFVATRGKVRLRWIPEKMAQCSENVDTKSRSRGTTECTKRKTKPCWMVAHHPDGCPYPPEVCDFIHLTDV
ncbi:unnamed protein product [Calicophoron daubneyi]|uniref:tRNA (uracil-O(2)-)-methyltransferase n=1 Tax=Calicophoron daubneyi TaxID=300641 RepID=A0AAV2TDY9_CALDB